MTVSVKQQLYNFCQAYADGRITRIQENIKDIRAALDTETKSSTGDKYETGRAMLQLELEKLGNQLAEANAVKQLLGKVGTNQHLGQVAIGSLVSTSQRDFFLSISAGECTANGVKVFCISPNTPIGQLLMGKSVGATIAFNGQRIVVLEIN